MGNAVNQAIGWYNGYSPEERLQLWKLFKRDERSGALPLAPKSCSLCNDPSAQLELHSEIYSADFGWKPPAQFYLCRHCHRLKLHRRFSAPEAWADHIAHVRRGGYASELSLLAVQTEMRQFRRLRILGEAPILRPLRAYPAEAGKEWFALLRMDAASLTDSAARFPPSNSNSSIEFPVASQISGRGASFMSPLEAIGKSDLSIASEPEILGKSSRAPQEPALSWPTEGPRCAQSIAETVSVAAYLTAALADNTRRAYRSDLKDFLAWGGKVPCDADLLVKYLADRAETLSPYTMRRRLVGIGRAHTSQGLASPVESDLVRVVMRGIFRVKGSPQRRVRPLTNTDLRSLLLGLAGVSAVRDRALLLLGFAAALRRSELVAVQVEDVEFVPEGMVLLLRRGKTDQEGVGRKIGVPHGRTEMCPVKAVKVWLTAAKIDSGPMFRPISRVGRIGDEALSSQSVALVVKRITKNAGYEDEMYSGHSLRAGLVTSAARAGVSIHKIQQQTGHRSLEMLSRYVRDENIFEENAAGLVL